MKMTIGAGSMTRDLKGQTFGSWTVLRFHLYHKCRAAFWMCQCSCGNERSIRGSALFAGKTYQCNACKGRKAEGVASCNRAFHSCQASAHKRNYEWDLTLDDFKNITRLPCFYCGAAPGNRVMAPRANGAFIWSGIDRKNNREGYHLENIVPCCKICNVAKSAMSVEEFLEWINRIVEHQKVARIASLPTVIDERNRTEEIRGVCV
jgi:hypothetical protein